MANVYVRSGAGGAATGADWANAYLTLGAAATAKAAGDTFWVSEDHAESTAGAVTITFPGTAASPNFCYCVNHAGTVPPVSADLSTTGTVTTTGANALTVVGHVYVYGLTFNSGSGAVGTPLNIATVPPNANSMYFKNCTLAKLGTTAAGRAIIIGQSAANTVTSKVVLDNTVLTFGATGDGLAVYQRFDWLNTASALAGATPTTLFGSTTAGGGDVYVHGVDLSTIAGTIFASYFSARKAILSRCKLNASATISATPAGLGYQEPILLNCDSGATNYRNEKYAYTGTQTTETTIVRTGGATDGTTPVAWKLVTTANSKWAFPFDSLPITIWNDTTGSSITVTIYGIWGGGAVPNNDDIWVEAEYLGSSATPISSFGNTTKADGLAANAATTSDSSTWGGSTTKFKMAVTFTPQLKGPIQIVIKAAAASSTFYIDPKPEISGVTVSKSFVLLPGVNANEISSATTTANLLQGKL